MTAFGTLIMIPKYMSPDFVRDINTPVITEFHKARGATQVSEKRNQTRIQREEELRRCCLADVEARRLDLKGEKRRIYILKQSGLPLSTDARQLRRWLKDGAKLVGEHKETTSTPSMEAESDEIPTTDRLEQVKAIVNALSTEEKRTFVEWLRKLGVHST